MTPKTDKKKVTAWMMLMKMKNPEEIFDLVIWGAYNCGSFGANVPVEETRKVFEHIKKLLTKHAKTN